MMAAVTTTFSSLGMSYIPRSAWCPGPQAFNSSGYVTFTSISLDSPSPTLTTTGMLGDKSFNFATSSPTVISLLLQPLNRAADQLLDARRDVRPVRAHLDRDVL